MDTSSFFEYPDQKPDDETEDEVLLPKWRDEDWAKLLAYTNVQRLDAGEVVMEPGVTERTIYFVSEGTLEIILDQAPSRKPRRLSLVKSGSFVGELAFFDVRARSATVQAVTDCELLRLSRDAFDVFAVREAVLARDLLFDLGRILSMRLRRANLFIAQWVR